MEQNKQQLPQSQYAPQNVQKKKPYLPPVNKDQQQTQSDKKQPQQQQQQQQQYQQKQQPQQPVSKGPINSRAGMKKPGVLDQLWQALVYPPSRLKYQISDLGPQIFILQNTQARREDFQVTNSRGHKMECSYFEPFSVIDKPHPAVIYLHGNSSSRLEGMTLLQYLLPIGIAVVLMDFAGCGISEGEYISLGYYEKDDAKLVIDRVKKSYNICSFGIWGRSMGAATSLMVATTRDDIEFVVADSSFIGVKELCQDLAKKQYKLPNFISKVAWNYLRKKIQNKVEFDINECNTLKFIQEAKFKPNILFISAKDDTLIDYTHSEQLFDNYEGNKNILLFEGTHNSRRPRYIMQEIQQCFKLNMTFAKTENPIQKNKTLINKQTSLVGGINLSNDNLNYQSQYSNRSYYEDIDQLQNLTLKNLQHKFSKDKKILQLQQHQVNQFKQSSQNLINNKMQNISLKPFDQKQFDMDDDIPIDEDEDNNIDQNQNKNKQQLKSQQSQENLQQNNDQQKIYPLKNQENPNYNKVQTENDQIVYINANNDDENEQQKVYEQQDQLGKAEIDNQNIFGKRQSVVTELQDQLQEQQTIQNRNNQDQMYTETKIENREIPIALKTQEDGLESRNNISMQQQE